MGDLKLDEIKKTLDVALKCDCNEHRMKRIEKKLDIVLKILSEE